MFEINKSNSSKFQANSQNSSDASALNDVWFTCSSKAYDFETQEEFLAVATNEGRIFRVEFRGGGA